MRLSTSSHSLSSRGRESWLLGAEKVFDTDDQGGFGSKPNIVSGGVRYPKAFLGVRVEPLLYLLTLFA